MDRVTRIGILTINDPRRGLWRDAECLLWALAEESPRRLGWSSAVVSLYPVDSYRALSRDPAAARAASVKMPCSAAVPSGTRFGDWLKSLDVLVVFEKLLPQAFELAKRSRLGLVFIPNLDWADLHGSVQAWIQAVKSSGCQVWAKTGRIAEALKQVGLSAELVPWSIPDPVVRDRATRPSDAVTFLLNAGMGGWRNRRGVDIALHAFALAQHQAPDLRLTIKSIKPLAHYVSHELLNLPGLDVIEGLVSRHELAELYRQADAILYPSRWEGFGLSLLEALHAGLPALATDGWPMNELVEHGHNGLLVKAQLKGTIRLASHWECAPAELAEAMLRFAADPHLRRRLTCPEPAELVARQHRFIVRVRELLLGEPPPAVALFRPRSEPSWRRSEEYWADALRAHGYLVYQAFFESNPEEIRECLRQLPDFVLVGKAAPQFLATVRNLTTCPIVLWHHDPCQPRLQWMYAIQRQVDLLCVPESGLKERFSGLGVPVLTLLPGAKVDGDRGPGRRPIHLPEADTGPDIAFLGAGCSEGNRKPILWELSQHFDVRIYGAGWGGNSSQAHSPVWSQQAAAVNRGAKVVLSISRTNRAPHYTSNRLFHSTGVGACVVAEEYPGIDDHFPPEAVARFHNLEECTRLVSRLLKNPTRRALMRATAEDHTWRYHTWLDRVNELLWAVKNLSLARSKPDRAVTWWDERARRLRYRAVGYFRWSEARFRTESQAWWNRLWPHLARLEDNSLSLALDFGCGTGRFAAQLSGKGMRVVGVDISGEMLRLAEPARREGLQAVQVAPGEPLPFATGIFDVLWVCTVLQHIPDAEFDWVAQELRRVLRPGCGLVMCENTNPNGGRTSRTGHVVFRQPEEYLATFPGIRIVDQFRVEGEQHTVFAGRIKNQGSFSTTTRF